MADKGRRAKGAGGIYQRASDGMWCVSIELPSDGTRRRRKVICRARKADAVQALRDARKELERAGDLTTSSPTVEQWMTLWLVEKAKRLKPRTLADYQSVSAAYIVPAIGRTRLDKLTPASVRKLHDFVTGQGLSSTTALKAHRVFAVALRDAEREGRATRNVARLLEAPPKEVSNRRSLTVDEAKTLLLSVADNPLEAAAWSLALLTGMRRGELCGLTTDHYDRSTITVAWQLQRIPRKTPVPNSQEHRHVTGGLYLVRPKSRAGWRQIPVAPLLTAVLDRYQSDTSPGPEGLILTNGGQPIDPDNLSRMWKAALERAGLPAVPLHSARHTTATFLYELGVPPDTRMAILGHSEATVTAGYTHVSDALKVDAMGQLGALLAAGGD